MMAYPLDPPTPPDPVPEESVLPFDALVEVLSTSLLSPPALAP